MTIINRIFNYRIILLSFRPIITTVQLLNCDCVMSVLSLNSLDLIGLDHY